MTERNPASFLSGESHPAEHDRLLVASLIGGPSSGVCGPTDLKVTPRAGTPNMSVDVAAGSAFIAGSESTNQGVYHVVNDGTVNLPVAAAHQSLPRRDRVVARVEDQEYGVATVSEWRLEVITGVPSAAPELPAEPDNALTLAELFIAFGATAIDNGGGGGVITDRRVASDVWARPRGRVAYVETSSLNDANSVLADTTGLTTGLYSQVAGRIYRFEMSAEVAVTGDTTIGLIQIADGTNSVIVAKQVTQLGGLTRETTIAGTLTATTSGTVLAKVRHQAVNGSGTFNVFATSGARKAYLLVEDIGGTLL